MADASSRSSSSLCKPSILDLRQHGSAFVTVHQLARYWQIGVKVLYKQIDAGLLPAVRLGPRCLRVSVRAALHFEEASKTESLGTTAVAPSKTQTLSTRSRLEDANARPKAPVSVKRKSAKTRVA